MDKKDIIVKETEKLVSRFGIKKTNLDDIARASGLAKASIYHYFSSKDEIINSVIQKDIARIQKKCCSVIRERESITEKLVLFFETHMKQYNQLLTKYLYFSKEYYCFDNMTEQLRNEFHQSEMEILVEILEETGEKADILLSILQTLLIGYEMEMIQGASFQTISNKIELQMSYILS